VRPYVDRTIFFHDCYWLYDWLVCYVQSLKYANMPEISDVMDWIDEFGMTLAWNTNGMVGYKCWYGIGM